MDRLRAGSPQYARQRSGGSSSTGSSSPGGSSPGRHHRAPSLSSTPSGAAISNVKRTQNVAARAAAARLAQVMASQTAAAAAGGGGYDDYDDEDDDFGGGGGGAVGVTSRRYAGARAVSLGNGAASLLGRPTRSPSPAAVPSGRNFLDPLPATRSTSAGRQAATARPASATVVPAIKNSLRTPSPIPAIEPPVELTRPKRFTSDAVQFNSREPSARHNASSGLQDELDMLQEENDSIMEKLRIAEEKFEEAEARAKELEKQVAALGEGVSLEARHLSRKEAALRQREAALKAAKESKDGKDVEVTALKQELQSVKEDLAMAAEHLKDSETEKKNLQLMTQRMVLSQEEMEEVVLKRCWLARYWGLAVQYGVYPEIAVSKHEHWSSLAPLPLEVVLSAGQKAKDEPPKQGQNGQLKKSKLVREMSDVLGDGNIESMLSVEMGLRELASLKVEDAVVLSLSHHRRPNTARLATSDFKAPGEAKFSEAFDLSYEEAEDVSFKQAWLIYFWRRAKNHGIEEDIADERLQFWIGRNAQAANSHDAIDVERGITELRKLGIEQQLWEDSRLDIDQSSSGKERLHE